MENKERSHSGHVLLGFILLLVGGVLILQQASYPLPFWLISWKTLLIVIGLFVGIQRGFRGAGWLVLMLIGGAFLIEDLIPGFSFHHYIWPTIMVIAGIWLIISPKGPRRWRSQHHEWKKYTPETTSSQDYLDSTCVFGSVRKVILSKDFKGGECVSFMGGTELDLSQADFNGSIVLDVTQVFGGTKLIVPAHWNIKSELASVFAGIEDKRNIQSVTINEDKVLVLKGTSVFGGIEIRNY